MHFLSHCSMSVCFFYKYWVEAYRLDTNVNSVIVFLRLSSAIDLDFEMTPAELY